MGQNPSSEEFHPELFKEDLFRNQIILAEIALLTYDEFVKHLGELNKLSKKCLDEHGKQLVFAVKKGTDSSILWKGTVKIGCVKYNKVTSSVESYRLLNLAEFMKVLKTFKGHMECIEKTKNRCISTENEPSTSTKVDSDAKQENKYMTASLLLQHVDEISSGKIVLEKSSECCICLERRPEVILPCTHSYCLPCIEQWNVNHKTCPICRERFETTDDTWVISEAPDADEITAEICSALNELSELSPKHRPK